MRAVLAEANAKGRITSAGDWEDVLFAYRSQLLSVSATEGMADSVISALRIALDGLSSGRIVPTTAMPIPGVKHVRRRRSHLRSFAEAGTTNDSDIEHDYVAFARERFLHAAKGIWLDMGASESDEFISGLALELFGALEAARMVELSHVRDTKYDSTEPLCSTAQSERTE